MAIFASGWCRIDTSRRLASYRCLSLGLSYRWTVFLPHKRKPYTSVFIYMADQRKHITVYIAGNSILLCAG